MTSQYVVQNLSTKEYLAKNQWSLYFNMSYHAAIRFHSKEMAMMVLIEQEKKDKTSEDPLLKSDCKIIKVVSFEN